MKNPDPVLSKGSRANLVRRHVQARIPGAALARSSVALGAPEIVGLSISLLLLITAIVSYFYALVPARERLQTAEAAISREQTLLRESGQGLQKGNEEQATVAEIVASLREFEASYLPLQTEGQIAVVEELNDSIRRHNLRNAGLTFTPPDPTANATSQRSGSRNLQSVFPGLGLTVGVEGTYTDVRRFVYGIEASRQFLIINSIELEGVKDAGKGANTLVTLNLNMTAYFRPNESATGSVPEASASDSASSRPSTR